MTSRWKSTVTLALHRYSKRHASLQIERSAFIREELPAMLRETLSAGRTPAQTVSRVLQELRDEGKLFFSDSGVYVLTDAAINTVDEDFPDDVLDHAARAGTLVLDDVATANVVGQSRTRRGMAAVRRTALSNYEHRCAVCDVADAPLLVASHIARWADRPDARGHLTNVICLCRLHDPLFELGYFALSDQLTVLWRPAIASSALRKWSTGSTEPFRLPLRQAPSPLYLQEHRSRVGLPAAALP